MNPLDHKDTSTGVTSQTQASWSLASERLLICAALSESRADIIREISNQLVATDFFEESHINIWHCRSSLADAGVAHDLASVVDTAKKLGLFIGGADYVLGLMRDPTLQVSSDLTLKSAAKRVKDFAARRSLLDALQAAVQMGGDDTQSHETIMGFVSDTLENIKQQDMVRRTGPVHVMHAVAAVTEQIEMRLNGEVPQNITTTGSDALDRLITGFADEDLIILAARPSMGKTAMSLAMAQAAAEFGGRQVLYFSTEQGSTALAYRLIASAARINATRLKQGEFEDGELERMVEGASKTASLALHIDETSEITMPEIRARARIFAQKHARPIIFVDYLQRIKSHKSDSFNDSSSGHRLMIGEITTGLKNLGKELKCPVVALAQLNRKVEDRANKRPMLSDLADSGKIEQDADIILFLYRDDYYNPSSKDIGITEVIAGKNRDGSIGVVKRYFDKNTQHFEDTFS